MAFGWEHTLVTIDGVFALWTCQVLHAVGLRLVDDVGGGSGVSQVPSSLLGAKEICAYDLDDVAVQWQGSIDYMNPTCRKYPILLPGIVFLKGAWHWRSWYLSCVYVHGRYSPHPPDGRVPTILVGTSYLSMSGLSLKNEGYGALHRLKTGFFPRNSHGSGEWEILFVSSRRQIEMPKGVIWVNATIFLLPGAG